MHQPYAGRLAGRSAIVTGASRGIGLAIAQRLVEEGARVCLTARSPEPLAGAVATLPPGSAIAVAGRSHDPAHQEETIGRAVEAFGRLDILVLNAGINPAYGPMAELDLAAARKILEVNVLAPLAWTQRVLRLAPGFAGRGAVVAVGSVTADTPSPGIGMYGVSKAALAHLVRTMAAELGPGVRVNAVSPGVVKTQFAKALYEGREDEVAAAYPLKRLGRPEDVAGAVAYLASDDAAWVSGEVLAVDGGLAVAGGTA